MYHESDLSWAGYPTLNVNMAKFDPRWEGYPDWQTGLPALVGHPTYHVNVIKLKWEFIWTGGFQQGPAYKKEGPDPNKGSYLTYLGSSISM